jgi:hypothetical protein
MELKNRYFKLSEIQVYSIDQIYVISIIRGVRTESNLCKEFCRLPPNHSATPPYLLPGRRAISITKHVNIKPVEIPGIRVVKLA